jgi:phosphatidylglycerol:prolipoprotein diacylglycerol transferase
METRLAQFLEEQLGAGFLVPDYALLYTVAALLGLYLAVRKAGAAGLDPLAVFKAGVITIGMAFVSARLFVVAQNFDAFVEDPIEALIVWRGGTASSGAYIGGFIAAMAAARWQQLPVAKFLDCCAPSAALAIAIGRAGCFLHGCCYGKPSGLPWAVSFPSGSEPHSKQLAEGLITPDRLSLPLHPTQLYEALFAFSLFLFLIRCSRKPRPEGELAALLFLLYPVARFLNEFLRDDYRGSLFGVSVPQLVAVAAMTGAFIVLGWTRARGGTHDKSPAVKCLVSPGDEGARHYGA